MQAAVNAVRNAMGAETGFGAGASRDVVQRIRRRAGSMPPEVIVYVVGVVMFIILTLPPVWTLLNYVTPKSVRLRNDSGRLSVVGYVSMLLIYCSSVAIALVASRAAVSRQRVRQRRELEEAAGSRRR